MTAAPPDPRDAIDAFVAYLARLAPALARRAVGASSAEVDRVASLAPGALPPELRALLARLGRTPRDALAPFLEGLAFGVDEVERFYDEPPVPLPADAVYFGALDGDQRLFLPCAHPGPAWAPVLWLSWPRNPATGRLVDGERGRVVVADSLPQHLYRDAFRTLRWPALAHEVRLRERVAAPKPDAPRRAAHHRAFRAIAGRLGFEPVPYVDGALTWFDRADAAALLSLEDVAPDGVYLRASDAREAARLGEVFADNLGFSHFGRG